MFKTSFVIFLLLTGCSLSPFIDYRREVGSDEPVGISTSDYPAICYNSRYTTPDVIIEMADKECAKTNRKAVFYRQTKFTCKMFMPHHAIYQCVQP